MTFTNRYDRTSLRSHLELTREDEKEMTNASVEDGSRDRKEDQIR